VAKALRQGEPHLTRRLRCAVYTRKSTEEGLDQEYNSIDAQRDAGHAYIASQRAEGWIPIADDYDDHAYSGGTLIVSPNDLEVRFRPNGIEVLALELQPEPATEDVEEAVA
jgi:hypothetical protein